MNNGLLLLLSVGLVAFAVTPLVNGKPSTLYDDTNPNWAPSVSMGYDARQPQTQRYDRKQERKKRIHINNCAHALLELSKGANTCSSELPAEGFTSVDDIVKEPRKTCRFILRGRLEYEHVKPVEKAKAVRIQELTETELNRLTVENIELKKEVAMMEITEETFKSSDEKVKFYTGLPSFLTLMALFHLVENYIRHTSRSKLSKFQQFVMVLMKLRLNLPVQDLANRFRVSPSTVSKIFLAVLDVLYCRLKNLVFWPERDELRKTMPLGFRSNFGLKVAIIIDCFEMFIDRPSELRARAATWSTYKHHNTVKVLIGITPQGVISYLSQCWGGRTSDKHITENCGFLDKILPGDLILADRGFDIKGVVGLQGVEAKIPAFTKGKSQLSPLELESTRKISHLRIHVERVIGLFIRNKYTILQCTLPIDYLLCQDEEIPVVEKMVNVCAALTNLNESVVPFN